MAERKMNVEAMTRHHPSIYVGFNIVFSRLKKGELLGKGGFSNVYQATYFGQDVAVKEIHDEAASKLTGDAMEDIEHECQLHYNLRHDNVVELLCFNTSPDLGPISLVMRRMAASCFDMLHSRVIPTPLAYLFSPMDRELHGGVAPPPSPLPLRTRCRMLLDAARGMAFLHGNGVLHLDVKSMNLMLTPSGCVQLNDFGMSKARAELGDQAEGDGGGEGVGSLPWMAPEMINQELPTPAADVFSFHVVMNELITGELPHADRSPQAIVKFMSRAKRLPLPTSAALESQAAIARATRAEICASARANARRLAKTRREAGSAYLAPSAAEVTAGISYSTEGNGAAAAAAASGGSGGAGGAGGATLGNGAGRVRAEALPQPLRVLYAECGAEDPTERPGFEDVVIALESILSGLPEDEDNEEDEEDEEEDAVEEYIDENEQTKDEAEDVVAQGHGATKGVVLSEEQDEKAPHEPCSTIPEEKAEDEASQQTSNAHDVSSPLPSSSPPLSLPPPPVDTPPLPLPAVPPLEDRRTSVVGMLALEDLVARSTTTNIDTSDHESSEKEEEEEGEDETSCSSASFDSAFPKPSTALVSPKQRRPSLMSGISRVREHFGGGSARGGGGGGRVRGEQQRRSSKTAASSSSSSYPLQKQWSATETGTALGRRGVPLKPCVVSASAISAEALELDVSPQALALVRAANLLHSTADQLKEFKQCFDEDMVSEQQQQRVEKASESEAASESETASESGALKSVQPLLLSWQAVVRALPLASPQPLADTRRQASIEGDGEEEATGTQPDSPVSTASTTLALSTHSGVTTSSSAPVSTPNFSSWVLSLSQSAQASSPPSSLSSSLSSSASSSSTTDATATAAAPAARHWWSFLFDPDSEQQSAAPALHADNFEGSKVNHGKAKALPPSHASRPTSSSWPAAAGRASSGAAADTLSGVDLDELVTSLESSAPLDELFRLQALVKKCGGKTQHGDCAVKEEGPPFSLEASLEFLLPLLPRTFVCPPIVRLNSSESSPRSSTTSPRPSAASRDDEKPAALRASPPQANSSDNEKSRPSLGDRTLSAPTRMQFSLHGDGGEVANEHKASTPPHGKADKVAERESWDGGWDGVLSTDGSDDDGVERGRPMRLFTRLPNSGRVGKMQPGKKNSGERNVRLSGSSGRPSSSSVGGKGGYGIDVFAHDHAASALKASVARVAVELKASAGECVEGAGPNPAAAISEDTRRSADGNRGDLGDLLALLFADFSPGRC